MCTSDFFMINYSLIVTVIKNDNLKLMKNEFYDIDYFEMNENSKNLLIKYIQKYIFQGS